MKAKLKSIYSSEINDLQNYVPESPENFCLLFRAMVGPEDSEGEESFDIQVCTPQWLLSTLKKEDVIPGKDLLIVVEYNFERIFNKIKYLIESCSGKDWHEVARKVANIGYWEFEDYIE